MVAGPTPRTGSLFQMVQGLIGTFYRGDPLLLVGTDFPVNILKEDLYMLPIDPRIVSEDWPM